MLVCPVHLRKFANPGRPQLHVQPNLARHEMNRVFSSSVNTFRLGRPYNVVDEVGGGSDDE